MAWPYLGPWQSPQGPVREAQDLLEGGHPTVPGPTDVDQAYPRLPTIDVSPGNGIAGRPRYKQRAPQHGKMGAMRPGPVPTGPVQPGVDYDSGTPT
jgi:hypothetical protein